MILRCIFLALTIISLSSCSSVIKIDNEKGVDKQFVENTRVFLSLPKLGDFRPAMSYNGYEEVSGYWKVKVMGAKKSMDVLRKTYAPANLKLLKANYIDSNDVVFANGYSGFYVNYEDKRRGDLVHLLVVDTGEGIIRIKGTINPQNPDALKTAIKKMVLSPHICTVAEAKAYQKTAESTPNMSSDIFNIGSMDFQFAGELDNVYYYSKNGKHPIDESDPPSTWVSFSLTWGGDVVSWKDGALEKLIGKDFTIIEEYEAPRNYHFWIAESAAKDAIAIAGTIGKREINIMKGKSSDTSEASQKELKERALYTKVNREFGSRGY